MGGGTQFLNARARLLNCGLLAIAGWLEAVRLFTFYAFVAVPRWRRCGGKANLVIG